MKHINKLCIKFFQTLGLVLLLVPILCTAEIVSIGPHQIYIPMPIGNCTFQESNPEHIGHIEMMRDGLKQLGGIYLLSSTDCENLKNLERTAYSLPPDTAVVATLSDSVDEKIPMNTEEFVATLRQVFIDMGQEELDDIFNESNVIANNALEKHSSTLKLGEPTSLGILNDDKNAVYVGLVRQVALENGLEMNLLTISAFTLVNGKVVLLGLNRKFSDGELPKSVRQALTDFKRWVGRVENAN